MFTEAAFDSAVQDLATLNEIPVETAGRYLASIGDTPEVAADGQVIVRDDAGAELARVRLE